MMSKCGNCIKNGIIGGIILFIWGMISWMVFPWHMNVINGFTDSTAVAQAVTSNAPRSGIYVLPYTQADSESATTTQVMPQLFLSVNLKGAETMMIKPMVIGLLTQIIAAILVAWMLSKVVGLSYFGRVGFVVVFALAAGIVTDIPYWNWFAFDANYTLIVIADMLIGWFLAGLAMAKFVKY